MDITFIEIQRFNKWWHYLLAAFPMALVTGIFLAARMNDVSNPDDRLASVIMGSTMFILLMAFIWFLLLRLETHMDSNGIKVNYKWMPFCKRTIPWDEIKQISVIDYSPLSDYGGWGVRYSASGNGWCYNVAGDKGIKLFYQTGKPFLIGTQQAEKAEQIIDHYFKH
jgi:hypothetical protein